MVKGASQMPTFVSQMRTNKELLIVKIGNLLTSGLVRVQTFQNRDFVSCQFLNNSPIASSWIKSKVLADSSMLGL